MANKRGSPQNFPPEVRALGGPARKEQTQSRIDLALASDDLAVVLDQLNPRMRAFAEARAAGMTQQDAYVKAGYKPATSGGSRPSKLNKHPVISKAIAMLIGARKEATQNVVLDKDIESVLWDLVDNSNDSTKVSALSLLNRIEESKPAQDATRNDIPALMARIPETVTKLSALGVRIPGVRLYPPGMTGLVKDQPKEPDDAPDV